MKDNFVSPNFLVYVYIFLPHLSVGEIQNQTLSIVTF